MARIPLKTLEAISASGRQIDWTRMESEAWYEMFEFGRMLDRRRNCDAEDLTMGGSVAYLSFNKDGTVNGRCMDTHPDLIGIPPENLGRCPYEAALEAANRVNLQPSLNPCNTQNWQWHRTPYIQIEEIGHEQVAADIYDYDCGADEKCDEKCDVDHNDETIDYEKRYASNIAAYERHLDLIEIKDMNYKAEYADAIERFAAHLGLIEIDDMFMPWTRTRQYNGKDLGRQHISKMYDGRQWARHKRGVVRHPPCKRSSGLAMMDASNDPPVEEASSAAA